jgi:arginyl-tRNA synthetase
MFDALSRNKIERYLAERNISGNYRSYRPQRNFGDISFDFQKTNVELDRAGVEALSDSNVKFSLSGKFVNVKYDNLAFSRAVIDSAMSGALFDFGRKQKSVLIEHTSSNPNAPLHVGRARNSIIGDTLSRILEKFGYDVKREYYVNDIGTQVEALLLATELFGDENYTESYRKISENMKKYETEIEEYMKRAESGDLDFLQKSRKKLEVYLEDLLTDLYKLDIRFDNFVWESEFILDGSVNKVMEMLSPVIKDDNGAKYIDSPDGKIYLVRSNGTSVYFTRDVAYHLSKVKKYDTSIDVLGEDHKNHFRKLMFVMDFMNVKGIDPVFYSFITLKEGKMSTRRGNVVYLRELIQEAVNNAREEIMKRRNDLDGSQLEEIAEKIGISAVRYNIIKYSPEKPITFDWQEALNFEGDAAPFIMYSYARAKSILSKAEKTMEVNWNFVDSESSLLRVIALYPEVVEDAANHYRPDKIAKYAFELASMFNQFYRDCPVIGDIDNYQKRVEIVRIAVRTMEQIFYMLGIKPSDKI